MELPNFLPEIDDRDTLLYLSFVITTIVSVIAFVLWRNNQSRRKVNLALATANDVIEKQNNELVSLSEELSSRPNENNLQDRIIINIPNEQRRLFNDLMMGFEEYSKLKGYSVTFSMDNSVSNEIGFKFTVLDPGRNTSNESIRKDIQEYIEKVKAGDDLRDIPEIINHFEHELILTTLLNRISFLQHNYQLKKNGLEFYENFLKKLAEINPIDYQKSPIMINQGGVLNSQNLSAVNSPGSIQGTNIDEVSSTIKIGNSFNERKNQIEDLTRLIKMINTSGVNSEEAKIAMTNLEKVKDEISKEKEPNKQSVEKWLKNAKTYFDLAKLGKEIVEFGAKVFETFTVNSP